MSLMKWTLAMAGAAMGVRYMSDRHRRRLGGESGSTGGGRGAPMDRDTTRPWSATAGRTDSATGPAMGAGVPHSGPGATARTDDLQAPDSPLAPGQSAKRF